MRNGRDFFSSSYSLALAEYAEVDPLRRIICARRPEYDVVALTSEDVKANATTLLEPGNMSVRRGITT
jgi:hypothetical protein